MVGPDADLLGFPGYTVVVYHIRTLKKKKNKIAPTVGLFQFNVFTPLGYKKEATGGERSPLGQLRLFFRFAKVGTARLCCLTFFDFFLAFAPYRRQIASGRVSTNWEQWAKAGAKIGVGGSSKPLSLPTIPKRIKSPWHEHTRLHSNTRTLLNPDLAREPIAPVRTGPPLEPIIPHPPRIFSPPGQAYISRRRQFYTRSVR